MSWLKQYKKKHRKVSSLLSLQLQSWDIQFCWTRGRSGRFSFQWYRICIDEEWATCIILKLSSHSQWEVLFSNREGTISPSIGVERNHHFVYGRRVVLWADYKPLETICKKPLASAPKRLQCLLLRLQQYDVEICYRYFVPRLPANNRPLPHWKRGRANPCSRFLSHLRATAGKDPARNSSRTCPTVSHPRYRKGLAKEERWSADRTSPLLWRSRWTDSPGWRSLQRSSMPDSAKPQT